MATLADRWPEPAALGAARLAIASVVLAAPVTTARLFGADVATARRVTWLTRMLGIRDGALGAGTVRGTADAPAWLLGGAASDAVDAAVVLAGIRSGRYRGVVPAALVAGAGASVVVHTVAAVRFRRRG